MANTLTNLIPDMYEALDVVSRELTGMIPAVSRDSGVERAAVGQTVRIPVAPAATAADITPATDAPDTGDQTITNVSLGITKARAVPIRWTGEETMGLRNAGTFSTVNRDRFAQAIRTLVNEIESDLAGLYAKGSRAYGTAGTTPFATASELDDASETLRILEDNGAPMGDSHLVLGSAAMAKLRGYQSVLFKVNEAGTNELLRRGVIGELMGLMLHNSAQVKSHTKGTSSGHLVNDAGLAIGDTVITVDTGSGTILAGDVVTFAGDTNKYLVTSALSGSTFTIAAPGLRTAVADNSAITVGNAYTANMAFHRSAIVLATRLPALPEGGDMADDREVIVDDRTGLAFEVSAYREYRRVHLEVAAAWGYELIKPEHTAILLG